jgi:hypothetical protein
MRLGPVVGILAAIALTACAHVRAGGGAAECRPVGDAPLPAAANTAEMAGDFALTMVATGGAQSGRSVTGRLSLVPQDSALRAVERAAQPLRGTADIALESVGAARPGDLAATAPEAPGVAVYEQRAPNGTPTVYLRLGNESNARGPQAIEGVHTTGYVRRIAPDGFAGGWSSAGPRFPLNQARGYFCDVRAPLP